MRYLLILILLFSSLCLADTKQSFPAKIHRHKSTSNRVLVDKVGSVTFDDTRRVLAFSDDAKDNFEVPYDAVTKVVFDTTSHMRGGAASQVISATGLAGAIAGGAIAGARVSNYWFFVEYRDGDRTRQVLLEVPRDSNQAVRKEGSSIFGSKVSIASFPEKAEAIDTEKLPDIKSKASLSVDKQDHPLPEVKPDKATIVVVCPPLAARYAGRGNQIKLHANDHVVAVNKPGTYSFAYLDPGKYRLVSQSENADGFEMELRAGETYYFVQNTLQGAFKYGTLLSRNSPELVMYLVDGSYWSDWKPK